MVDEVKFELRLVGRVPGLGQVVSAPSQNSPQLEQRRKDQETGRRLANEYAEEMLLLNVHIARTSVDENIRLRASKQVMDRAWGLTKALTEEEKKGADAGSILDVLAAVSAMASAQERQAPDAPALEHDPQNPDESFEKLLDDINAEDAVIVND